MVLWITRYISVPLPYFVGFLRMSAITRMRHEVPCVYENIQSAECQTARNGDRLATTVWLPIEAVDYEAVLTKFDIHLLRE